MIDADCWYPPAHVTLHALPGDGSLLAPSREASLPTPRDLLLKPLQRFDIERHAIIAIMAQQHRAQPRALHGDGLVPSPSQLDFDLGHFDTKSLRHSPPLHPELASSRLPAHVRKAEKIEALRFAQTPLLTSFSREASELNQVRLVRVQVQTEGSQPRLQLLKELLGILTLFEPDDDVVNVADQAHVALAVPLTPLVSPKVKHIMKVDIGRQGRKTRTLRTAYLALHVLAVLDHTGFQPFLDESHDAPIRNPVLNELHQPSVLHGVEKSTDVDTEHPVHLTPNESHRQRIQRIVLASARATPIGEAEKVHFVDGMKHLDERCLDDFIFQGRYAQWPLPPIGFGNIGPPRGLCSVRASLEPLGKVLEVGRQFLAVLLPCHPVDTGNGLWI